MGGFRVSEDGTSLRILD